MFSKDEFKMYVCVNRGAMSHPDPFVGLGQQSGRVSGHKWPLDTLTSLQPETMGCKEKPRARFRPLVSNSTRKSL